MTLTVNDSTRTGLRTGCTPADIAAFGTEVLAPAAEEHYRRETLDFDAWRALADLGFWRIPVPVEWGGFGGTWRDLADAVGQLARSGRDLGFTLSAVAHAGLLRAVTEFGHDSQRARFLPALIGGAVGATALTETHGGSDVARTRTEAVLGARGYRLRGAKDHITNGPVADVALVLGRIPELGARHDITLFLVDADQPGVRHGRPEELLGLRTSPTGPLYFDDAELGPDAVLGNAGDGLDLLYNVISYDRLLYGLVAAAYLEPLLDEAVSFCRERSAFGAPILDYQYVQLRLTDIKVTIETSAAVSHAALDALLADRPDAVLACSVAKLVGSEGLARAAQHLLGIHGHAGYQRGPITTAVQDALGTLIAGGTTEMQRKNIFNQMVRIGGGR